MIFYSPKDDLIEVVSGYINRSRKRVWIATYLFTIPFIARKLVDKLKEGVDVRVILSTEKENFNMIKYLKGGGIAVRVFSDALLHAKVYVFDDCALVGSANLSHYGLNVSFEILIEVKGRDFDELVSVFKRLWRMSK